jgi:hypothetical protein
MFKIFGNIVLESLNPSLTFMESFRYHVYVLVKDESVLA